MSRESPQWYEPEFLMCERCGVGAGAGRVFEPQVGDWIGYEGDRCPVCGGFGIGCGPAGSFGVAGRRGTVS